MTNAARKEPNAAELTTELVALKKTAAKDPRLAKVVELRKKIVDLRQAGKVAGDPDVVELATERDAIKAEVFGPVQELSAKRGAALRAEREVAAHLAAEAWRKRSDDDLAAALQRVMATQRTLKAEKRALRVVLDERARKKATEALVQKMSPAERAEMLARLQAGDE